MMPGRNGSLKVAVLVFTPSALKSRKTVPVIWALSPPEHHNSVKATNAVAALLLRTTSLAGYIRRSSPNSRLETGCIRINSPKCNKPVAASVTGNTRCIFCSNPFIAGRKNSAILYKRGIKILSTTSGGAMEAAGAAGAIHCKKPNTARAITDKSAETARVMVNELFMKLIIFWQP